MKYIPAENTLLYHSPYDIICAFLVAKYKNLTSLEFDIVIDDIDSIGVDKSSPMNYYGFRRSFHYGKTRRTNLRPLSLNIPLNSATILRSTDWKSIEKDVPINKLKSYIYSNLNIEKLIQTLTKEFGFNALVGPDRASKFALVEDSFFDSMTEGRKLAIEYLQKLLSRDLNSDETLRLNLLFMYSGPHCLDKKS